MKIKILLCVAFNMAVLAAFAQQTNNFVLEGKLGISPAYPKIYLKYRTFWNTENPNVSDSAVVTNGRFSFSGFIRQPVLANLTTRDGEVMNFYLEPGRLVFNTAQSLKTAKVSGSPINAEWPVYQKALAGYTARFNEIKQLFLNRPAGKPRTPAYYDSLRLLSATNEHQKQIVQQAFIKQYPDSYFSLVSFKELVGRSRDTAFVGPIFRKLSPRLKNLDENEYYRNIFTSAETTGMGKLASTFTSKDMEGKTVNLSDYRGKYVLIDFWASWCGPCMAEMPNVVEAYQRFRSKNFVILGVSQDNEATRKPCLAAIAKNKMEWTTVLDINYKIGQKYGVTMIPRNFLLDPSGKVIAKDLRGKELQDALTKVLK